MANKKLTDFTTQATLNTSTRLYGVPYSGTGAFTDTQVPISVLFDTPTFTGVVTGTGSFNLTGALSAGSISTTGALSAASGTIGGSNIVTLSATQTLTNKTLTAPVISTISNTGTLTLPTSTDTLVGRATTDTLTNKTITAAALSGTFSGTPTFSGNVTFTSTITPSQTAGIVGTTTNNNANAGSVGEYGNVLGSAVALTTATNANITSQSLGAGDWDVWASIVYTNPGTTNIAAVVAGISTTSAAFPGDPLMLRLANQGAGFSVAGAIPQQRLLLSAPTTVYIVAQASFTVSTLTATAQLHWRRRR